MSELNTTPNPVSEHSPKILGHRIKQARAKAGSMGQKELAELLDISINTLIAIESGERDVPVGKIFAIAKHLRTTPHELLGLSPGTVVHNLHSNQQDGQVNILNSGQMSSERELFERLVADLQARIEDLLVDKINHRDEIAHLRAQLAELKGK